MNQSVIITDKMAG